MTGEEFRKKAEELLKQGYEEALRSIQRQSDLISGDIAPDKLDEAVAELDSISESLKGFLTAKSNVMQSVNKQNDSEISSKISDYLKSEFGINFDDEMSKLTSFKSTLGSDVSDEKIREYVLSLSDVGAFKKNAFLSLLDSNKDNYSLNLLASNVQQSKEAQAKNDWSSYSSYMAKMGELIAACPKDDSLIKSILDNPQVVLENGLQSNSLGENDKVETKANDEVQNVQPNVAENVEPAQQEPVVDASNEPVPVKPPIPTLNDESLKRGGDILDGKVNSTLSDTDVKGPKLADPLYVPTPISWDEICKMNFEGKTQYYTTRTFGNEYPIRKVNAKDDGIGQFVEYGKTPNGQIILVPNPKYYSDSQPILDKGVTVFSLFFDYENKYAERSSMELVPAVISDFKADSVLSEEILVTRGRAQTIKKKENVISDAGVKTGESDKTKMAPIQDDLLSVFSMPKPSQAREKARQNAVELLNHCKITGMDEKMISRVAESLYNASNIIRNEKNFADWALEEPDFKDIESYLVSSVKEHYLLDFQKDSVDLEKFMKYVFESEKEILGAVRSYKTVKTIHSSKESDGSGTLRLTDEDYTNSFVDDTLHLLGYDTFTDENRDAVDMVRGKIGEAFLILQEQDVYNNFVSKFPEWDDYLVPYFVGSIRSVLLYQDKDVTPENLTNDVMIKAVDYCCDMISQKLDEKKETENKDSYGDEKSLESWRGYDFEIPMESIERTELSGEPEDPLYGYRQIAMCVLGYTKVDRSNIGDILDMELELLKKREADHGEDGEEIDESSYDDIFDYIYDYYQRHDGTLARISKKVKKVVSVAEEKRAERALKKQEEKVKKDAEKREREKIREAKAEEVRKLRALRQETLEQHKTGLEKIAQQQNDIAKGINPRLFNSSSPDTFVMPDDVDESKRRGRR